MKRSACASASSGEATSIRAKPSISSLVSGYGPSITLNLPLTIFTRVPLVGRCKPPVINTVPDFIICSVYLPIACICSGLGGAAFGFCSYVIKNFIVSTHCSFFQSPVTGLHALVNRPWSGSTASQKFSSARSHGCGNRPNRPSSGLLEQPQDRVDG